MRYVAFHHLLVEPLWGGEPLRVSVTVDDAKRVNTGLTDAKGNPIYRVQDAVGFHRAKGRGACL